MNKSVKKRVGKYGKSKSVQKSAKLIHLTFKVRGLQDKGHQTVLYYFRLSKGLGTREHLFVSVKINYIFGYSDLQIYESGVKN
jgi:hypothetical protein